MVNLEIPWINIMSKMDLVTANPEDPSTGARNGLRRQKDIARFESLINFFLACRFSVIRTWFCWLNMRLLKSVRNGAIQPPMLQSYIHLFLHRCHYRLHSKLLTLSWLRYLDPDPLLIATTRGDKSDTINPRFHALNQAIVQLVSVWMVLCLAEMEEVRPLSLYYNVTSNSLLLSWLHRASRTMSDYSRRLKITPWCRFYHWISHRLIHWSTS